jgi:hypothetical protein
MRQDRLLCFWSCLGCKAIQPIMVLGGLIPCSDFSIEDNRAQGNPDQSQRALSRARLKAASSFLTPD